MSIFKNNDILITLGWNGNYNTLPISDLVKEYINTNYLVKKNIVSLPYSKDTVGDAFFSLKYVLDNCLNNYKKIVVTSSWHIERTKLIFNFFFNNDKLMSFLATNENSNLFKSSEKKSTKTFINMFENLKHKKLSIIENHLLNKHPLYSNKTR